MVMIRHVIVKSLKSAGFENLFEADDGKQALDLITQEQSKQDPFDLVFIDWNMPLMNGLEVVSRCHSIPELSKIPFIMISAERDHKQIVQALNSGVYDYIMKPFSPDILVDKIKNVFSNKTDAS